MDFAFTQEQEELKRQARSWLAERFPLDRNWDGPQDNAWSDLAELGWLGVSIQKLTPEQLEKLIVELRGKGRAVKEDARGMRGDLASAFRGESLDVETLGTIASRTTGAIDSARDAAIGAVLKIHDALDERQRAIVADLLESGPGFGRWRGRGGPYRA